MLHVSESRGDGVWLSLELQPAVSGGMLRQMEPARR